MAKQQTFGDKLKKREKDDKVSVLVIKWRFDENRGSLRKMKKIIKIDNMNDIANADID